MELEWSVLKLSCFWRALDEADENVVQWRKHLIERTDVQSFVDEELDHVIVAETVVDPDAQLVFLAFFDIKQMNGGMLCQQGLVKSKLEYVFLEVLLDPRNSTIQDFTSFVHQYNMVADLFNLFHPVGAEDDGGPFFR